VVIQYCDIRKIKTTDCLAEMTKAYEDGVISLSPISRGYDAFEADRRDLNDEPRAVRRQNWSIGPVMMALLET
jgi:hypothetical protein